jgi:hypothetical protein
MMEHLKLYLDGQKRKCNQVGVFIYMKPEQLKINLIVFFKNINSLLIFRGINLRLLIPRVLIRVSTLFFVLNFINQKCTHKKAQLYFAYVKSMNTKKNLFFGVINILLNPVKYKR